MWLVLDISKAHRRVCVRQADSGLQACAISTPSNNQGQVFLNCVGPCGVGSALCLWGRHPGVLQRVLRYVLSPGLLCLMRFADDFAALFKGAKAKAMVPELLAWLGLLGFPVTWRKCQGGTTLHWIGYEFNLVGLTWALASRGPPGRRTG